MQCGRPGSDPWIGKIPWSGAWQPTPIFLPGESSWTEESGGLQSMGSERVRHDKLYKLYDKEFIMICLIDSHTFMNLSPEKILTSIKVNKVFSFSMFHFLWNSKPLHFNCIELCSLQKFSPI